jgi:peptide/nickel transport system substrate-binding protein
VNTASPASGGVLREGYDYEFSRCDPGTGAHVDPSWCAIYQTLTVAAPDGSVGPMLATECIPDSDLRTWRFRVASGARFHSGDQCDAAAVAAALRMHADPNESPINAFFWKNVRAIDPDGPDVVLRLHEPAMAPPRLLRSWHSAVPNPATRTELGSRFGYEGADGTGPFRFVSVDAARHFEVARWADYPGSRTTWEENRGRPHLDSIRWIPILSEGDRAAALESGEVDCIQNASMLDFDRLQSNPELVVIEFQQSALVYLGLDHQSQLGFGDVRVRRAFAHAIDLEAIVANDLDGHATAAYGPIPSRSRWYDASVERRNRFDPRAAIALLEQAGHTAGADGIRLRVEAVVVEDAAVRRVATRIQQMLHDVGVELRLVEVQGFDALYSRLAEHPDAFISKWFWPEPVDAIIGFISSWSHAGPNFQRATSPAIDTACRAWERALDEKMQQEAASSIQQLSADELPLIPLFFPSAIWAHHRRVHGWRPNVHDLYPLYGDVWLEQ